MAERERLIELLIEVVAIHKHSFGPNEPTLETVASYLLANGVIVPPCKIGSTIFMLVTKRPKHGFPEFTFIKKSKLTYLNLERVMEDFGKTVFLTREEAEAKLREVNHGSDQI